MSTRNPNDLVYPLNELCLEHLRILEHKGIPVIITSVARLLSEQVALFFQGRASLEEVNMMREVAQEEAKALGHSHWLWDLGPGSKNNIVTKTIRSKHVINLLDQNQSNDKSRAYDLAICKDGKLFYDLKTDINDNDLKDWEEIANVGRSLGRIRPGADFINWKDWPHFELK